MYHCFQDVIFDEANGKTISAKGGQRARPSTSTVSSSRESGSSQRHDSTAQGSSGGSGASGGFGASGASGGSGDDPDDRQNPFRKKVVLSKLTLFDNDDDDEEEIEDEVVSSNPGSPRSISGRTVAVLDGNLPIAPDQALAIVVAGPPNPNPAAAGHVALAPNPNLGNQAYVKGNGVWMSYKDLMATSYPAKSCKVYLAAYISLEGYLKSIGQFDSEVAPDQLSILNYFHHLRTVKKWGATTLWSHFSRVNAVMKRSWGVNLTSYPRVTDLLKSYETGQKIKKASVFSPQEDSFRK
jgi:hypothetical protein